MTEKEIDRFNAERKAEYDRLQAQGHMERSDRMKAEGRLWYPTNKRQWPTN